MFIITLSTTFFTLYKHNIIQCLLIYECRDNGGINEGVNCKEKTTLVQLTVDSKDKINKTITATLFYNMSKYYVVS